MQEQNQELINSLIEKQKTTAYSQQVAMDPEENQLLVSRVVSAKYKVYVIILLILGVLLGTTYLPNAMDHYQAKVGEYEAKQAELNTITKTATDYEKYVAEVENIAQHEDEIVNCINGEDWECNLPDYIKDDMTTVVTYLEMGDLSSEKMGINEEKIIRNLDQYLIKNTPGEITSSTNGVIQRIEMGEQEIVKQLEVEVDDNWAKRKQQLQFIRIPVDVEITFDQKDDLITFVDNIENYIIENKEDRILYVIDEVSYDIMAYDEEQATDIALSAYYFK